jgi:hypothetical protein
MTIRNGRLGMNCKYRKTVLQKKCIQNVPDFNKNSKKEKFNETTLLSSVLRRIQILITSIFAKINKARFDFYANQGYSRPIQTKIKFTQLSMQISNSKLKLCSFRDVPDNEQDTAPLICINFYVFYGQKCMN